jgi:hypothetical protein
VTTLKNSDKKNWLPLTGFVPTQNAFATESETKPFRMKRSSKIVLMSSQYSVSLKSRSDEIIECVSGENGLFASYPHISGVVLFIERAGNYLFLYFSKPNVGSPLHISRGYIQSACQLIKVLAMECQSIGSGTNRAGGLRLAPSMSSSAHWWN